MTGRRTMKVWLGAVLCLPFLACEGDTPPATVPTDVSADDDGAGGDQGPPVAYAEGPFGVKEGEVITDLSFYDPFNEESVWLHQWYQDPKKKILMLVSTTGW